MDLGVENGFPAGNSGTGLPTLERLLTKEPKENKDRAKREIR